jgi:hypothetical protein
MREKEEEKRKRETVSTGSSTAKKEEPKAEPIDYSKLSTGVAYYKGYGENGLVIEVEANVWYKNVKTTGMLGFSYYEVYKAECRRFRYPNNANKWLFTSSSDCLYKCYSNSSSLCIPIQGIVFRLGEPKIY